MNAFNKIQSVRLASQHHLCQSSCGLNLPIVLLHGWGSDSRIWQSLLAPFKQIASVIEIDLPGFGASETIVNYDSEIVIKAVQQQLPQRCHILGWSLGGMLAARLALDFPEQVESLLLLASNAKFVADQQWPTAMAPASFADFYQGYQGAPRQTLKQFSSLQSLGDHNAITQVKQLRQLQPEPNDNWQPALELLSTLDLRSDLAELSCPSLWLFGEHDKLVPAAAAAAIGALLPVHNSQHKTQILHGCGHALPLDNSGQLAQQLTLFYRQFSKPEKPSGSDLAYALDKKKVAASFSGAALSYENYAQLQRAIGSKLMQKAATNSAQLIVDLGCGTGYFCDQLQQQHQAQVIGLDLAQGMLSYAKANQPNVGQWLCADGESLPLADQSVDGVFSSLAIQWCQQPERLFSEIKRVLKPGGWACIATLGPGTLTELRQSWAAVDDNIHVNRFIDLPPLKAAINGAGFAERSVVVDQQLMQYRQLGELTKELKRLGANNRNAGQGQGLNTRQSLLKLKSSYEQFRGKHGAEADMLPASYQVFYLNLKA